MLTLVEKWDTLLKNLLCWDKVRFRTGIGHQGLYTWYLSCLKFKVVKQHFPYFYINRILIFFAMYFRANWNDDSPPPSVKNIRISQPPSIRSSSNNNIVVPSKKSNMVRSYSQDTAIASPETSSMKQKPSYSDSSLDHSTKSKPLIQKTIKEQSPGVVEDDIYSTDSSIIDEDIKKKKRKLFPGFSKKSKAKGD